MMQKHHSSNDDCDDEDCGLKQLDMKKVIEQRWNICFLLNKDGTYRKSGNFRVYKISNL